MAMAWYNFFPNCNARESAFFIMFGRDPINKLNMLLHSVRRYFHDDNGLPNLEALKNIYQVYILIKDNTAKSFQPLYKGNYIVVKVHGNNVEI